MEDNVRTVQYEYPKDLMKFDRFTLYQEKDLFTGEWSNPKLVGKFCRDKQNELVMLIAGKRIRIVKCVNDTC